MWRTGIALGAAALFALAQDGPIRREGTHWVQVITGTLATPPEGKLKVETRGPITLQGQPSSGRINYTIKKRVRAKSEAEARVLLRAASVQAGVRRGVATIGLSENRSRISADMTLKCGQDLQAVTLSTSGGDIQVYDIDGVVQAETEGGSIRMDRIGSDVVVRTGGGELRFGAIGGSIRCFSGGGLIQVERAGRESWLETAGGDIFVRESGGPIHTSTAGGNIVVQRAASMVSARTSGGRIEVLQAGGIVLADNSGGSVQVGSSHGVRVASTGGSIRLRGSSGSLRAATDVGSILAELMQGSGLRDSILSTGAGDITVYIPSNLALTVKALNENGPGGRIVSEFSEILVRNAAEAAAMQSVMAEGALNGGGPILRLTSTGGTIYLKRQR